jgi:hypothetical protein
MSGAPECEVWLSVLSRDCPNGPVLEQAFGINIWCSKPSLLQYQVLTYLCYMPNELLAGLSALGVSSLQANVVSASELEIDNTAAAALIQLMAAP